MPSDDWTRTATDLPDRGGALCTAFDVRGRVHTLAGQTHQTAEVVTPAAKLWRTLEKFLREVLPWLSGLGRVRELEIGLFAYLLICLFAYYVNIETQRLPYLLITLLPLMGRLA